MPMTKIWDLAYEIDGDTINLEQDSGCGEVSRVDLHPMHVRQLACELGMFTGDADAWARIATLERRLRGLARRVESLDQWLAEDLGKDSVDLSLHSTFSQATADLAREYCADLSPSDAIAVPTHSERNAAPVKAGAKPKENPRETQRVRGADSGQQAGLPLEVQ